MVNIYHKDDFFQDSMERKDFLMKAYTLKEVSRKINIAPGTLRQWEKDYHEILEIPRSKQGARFYTELEIEQLLILKQMSRKKLSKDLIRQVIQKELKPDTCENITKTHEISLEVISETVPTAIEANPLINADQFFEAMEKYKKNFLNEIKDEIRSVVHKDVLDEVKKEISKGTFYTVKSLSDSLYKSSANTKDEIEKLSLSLEKSSEMNAASLQYLSNNIATVSLETSEEIYTLSKQLSETSEEISHYLDTTNDEISSLTEAISIDRKFFEEERREYRHDISQRELAFQQLLTSFRDVAVAKERKWWRFWS